MVGLLAMRAALSIPCVTRTDLYSNSKERVGSRSGCTPSRQVIDGIALQRAGSVVTICVPPTAKRLEITDIIAAYIVKHPESLESFGVGAVALGQAHLCDK